jgi:hypothetical protein
LPPWSLGTLGYGGHGFLIVSIRLFNKWRIDFEDRHKMEVFSIDVFTKAKKSKMAQFLSNQGSSIRNASIKAANVVLS